MIEDVRDSGEGLTLFAHDTLVTPLGRIVLGLWPGHKEQSPQRRTEGL